MNKKGIKEYKNRAVFAEEMLDKYISSLPNKMISDIGSGSGYMQNKIESLNAIWQPYDYVRKIEQSIIWDLNDPCPINDYKAGAVIFLEVLEHLANPLLGLQNISSHMEKGGILILTTPNPSSSKNIINLFLKGRLYAFQEKHLIEHHVFTTWEHIVTFFLERCGFEIVEYAIVDISYKNQKKTSIKEFIKGKVEDFIEYRNPKTKGMSYGLVARKIDNI